MDSILALHPAAQGLILGLPNIFSLDVAGLDNANGTHLVLASGKLVLQKTMSCN